MDTPLKYAGTNSIIAGFAFHDTTCDAVRTVRGPTHRMKTVPEPLFSGICLSPTITMVLVSAA